MKTAYFQQNSKKSIELTSADALKFVSLNFFHGNAYKNRSTVSKAVRNLKMDRFVFCPIIWVFLDSTRFAPILEAQMIFWNILFFIDTIGRISLKTKSIERKILCDKQESMRDLHKFTRTNIWFGFLSKRVMALWEHEHVYYWVIQKICTEQN